MLRSGEELISGYRLDKFLGRGQFGDVWQAQAPGGKLVALKFINIVGKQGLKEYRAIQKVKNIQHPHLMPIIAFWILDQEQNVLSDEVLEQLDLSAQGKQVDIRKTQMGEQPIPNTLVVAMLLGEASLYDYFEQCQEAGLAGIPVTELLDYMEEAAKGIDFLNRPCHDLGDGPVSIQHCDIKPHNMLLTGGAVQICDFGLARILDDVRQTKSVAGTPAYIAPESISGRRPSATTDQYSLAITYYEMRSGDLPFAEDDRNSQMAIMQAHMKGKLEFSLSPPSEAAVLRKATSVDPDQRFRTSLEMVRALRRSVEHPQPTPANLSGTMTADDHQSRAMSDSANSDLFTQTEVTDEPVEASATVDSLPIDGTMVVSADAADSLPQKAPAQPASPENTAEAAPERQDFRRSTASSSNMPLVAIALLLVVLLGSGGFFWWNSRQGDRGGNPAIGGGPDNGDPDHGNPDNGGNRTPQVAQRLHFEPADASVKINGKPMTLKNGTLELEQPQSNQIYVEATHDSGEWELAQTYSWSQLKALDFQIELRRTAQAYLAKAWRELDSTGFDQAVADYSQALQLNRALVDMPPPHWLHKHGPYINHMVLGDQGTWLGSVSDGNQNNAFAWRLQAEPPYAQPTPLPGQQDLLEAIDISHDGRWLATGGAGGKVQLWQLDKLNQGAIQLTGTEQDVLALDFDSASEYLAASSYGNAVVVWQLDRVPQQTAPQFKLEAHIESVPALAFVPGTHDLLTGSWDDSIKRWKLPPPAESDNAEITPIDLQGNLSTDINVIKVDAQGHWLAAGSTENVLLWDLTAANQPGVELVARGISIESLAFSPNSKLLAASDAEGNIDTWNLQPHEFPTTTRPLQAHKGAVVALAFSPDNRWLASGGDDRNILLWDMTNPLAQPTQLLGHTDKIRSLQFTPQHHWLISGSDDGRIGLWQYRRWLVIDRALRSQNAAPSIEARRRIPATPRQLIGTAY